MGVRSDENVSKMCQFLHHIERYVSTRFIEDINGVHNSIVDLNLTDNLAKGRTVHAAHTDGL